MEFLTRLITISVITTGVLSMSVPKLNDDIDIYRLPESIAPSLYQLEITVPNFYKVPTQYQGINVITFNVANYSVHQLELHQKGLNITKAQLLPSGSTDPIDLEIPDPDNITDIVLFDFPDVHLSGDGHQLSLEFSGHLSHEVLNGFYLTSYYDIEGIMRYVASTQFEPIHARKAFPCFDEPKLKAEFEIKITAPEGFISLSNTPGKIDESNPLTTVFERTPRMSTYLVAFIISDEFNSTTGTAIGEQDVKIWSRNEEVSLRSFAAETAAKLLKTMESYTGIPYDQLNIGKLDNVAVPELSAGAMENWGLITYKETLLLSDGSSNENMQTVATILGHEISHQWFGDLITFRWFTEVFLNEGFARYFEYHATAESFPEWELPKQFSISSTYAALDADCTGSSLALSSYVTSPAEILKRFDRISYDKGASILKMVQHVLGLEEFKNGLKDYVESSNIDGLATPTKLWKSLGKFTSNAKLDENVTLPDAMYTWTYTGGYPMINVIQNGSDVIISQKPIAGVVDVEWYVPISYGTSKVNSALNDTSVQIWLTPDNPEKTLSNILSDSNDWIILNPQDTGFYRPFYDDNLLARISKVINSNHENIDALSRAQLVNNLFYFAKTNSTDYNYQDVLKFSSYLRTETDYYTWYAAFKGFEQMFDRINTSNLRTALTAYLSGLIKNLYDTISFDKENPSDHIFTLKQTMVLSWACKLGIQDCVDTSKKLFSDFKTTNSSEKISNNFRKVVYCSALRTSNNITEDWNFLFNQYQTTDLPLEKRTILEALGCTKDEEVLKSYLDTSIREKSNLIKKQDASLVFSSVYSNNPEGAKVALAFILSNHDRFVHFYGNEVTEFLSLLSSVANKITDKKEIEALQTFLDLSSAGLTDEEIKQLNTTIAVSAENIVETLSLENQLVTFFADDGDDDNGDDDQPGKGVISRNVHIGIYPTIALVLIVNSYISSA